MSWNRPSNEAGKATPKGGRRIALWPICATILALLVVALLWFWIPQEEEHPREELRQNPDRESPQINTGDGKSNHPSSVNARSQSTNELIAAEMRPNVTALDNAMKSARVIKWKTREKPIFTNAFEATLATLLTAEPGSRFLNIDFEDEFDEAFEASLKNKIVIAPDDPKDVAALKTAVLQAEQEIREKAVGGVRPRDIVANARDEMNKIADIRDKLQETLNNYLDTGDDPEEVLRIAKEGNAILAEYGAQPLDAPDDADGAYEALIGAKTARIEVMDFEDRKRQKEQEKKSEK